MKKILDDNTIKKLVSKIKEKCNLTYFNRETDSTTASLIDIDATPTINSDNLVSSGGVERSLQRKQDKLTAGPNITIVDNVISTTGGGGGTVDDVKVDGVSVVSSGIANIDLSGKANASDVYTKQEVNTKLQTKAPLSDTNLLFDMLGNVPETTTVQAEIEQKSDKTTIITSSDTTATVELANNNEYRYANALSNLTITFPTEIPDDYITSVMFYSVGVPTNLTYPSGIKWSGDDIVSGEFVPASGKKYTLCLWYDGVVNGVVRGVTNA